MKISDINAVTLEKVNDAELVSLHHRVHQLYASLFEDNTKESSDGLTREDLVNAHLFLLDELDKRGFGHTESEIDKEFRAIDTNNLPDHIMVTPHFVSIVGSSVKESYGYNDVDILIRADLEGGQLKMSTDNVVLPVRKAITPNKDKLVHFIMNAAGPHADYIPLYDLMLVRRDYLQLVSVYELESKACKDDEKYRIKDEGEAHAEIAQKFWQDNWYKSYPKSGKGKFVYQHHWRGLTEDEAESASEKKLLDTNHSIHGDLRFKFNGSLFGFTTFLGTTEDVKKAGGNRVANLPNDDALQGTFKLHQPTEWLDVGKRSPFISGPGEVGSTSSSYSKIFAEDWGTYEIGMWREHFFELFLNGKTIKGRYLIEYAPVGEGGKRIWLLKKPADQKSYIDSHDKEKVSEEIKSKGQKYLIWAKPGKKPERIEL